MNLFRSISIYTFSNLSNKVAGFVLISVISFYISQEENGDFAIVTSMVNLLGPLILLSAHSAINLEFFRKDQGESNFSSYVSSALVNPVWATLLIAFILAIFSPLLSQWLDIDKKWFVLVVALSCVNVIPNFTSILYQARKMPTKHTIYNLGLTIVDMLLAIYLIVELSMGWEGRLFAMLASKVGFSIIGFYILWRSGFITKVIKKKYVQNAFLYGLPLIPHALAANVLDVSDKFFIKTMVSGAELGVYDYGYKVGSLILMFQASIVLAWTPFFYEKMKQINKRNKTYIISVSYLIMLLMLAACFALTIIAPYVFDWFIDEKFAEGIKYVFWVALAYVFLGFYKVFAGYIFYLKKNSILSYLAVFNITTNLLLNYFFIREYGAMGAAYATVISYFLFFLITAIISHRLYPMPWFQFGDVYRFIKEKYDNKDIF